jgi:hypothetical protein
MMTMTARLSLEKLLTNPYFALGFFLSMFFALPRCGGSVVMFFCAVLISAYVLVMPESFRSRSGSLVMARCLAGGMWIMWAIVVAIEFLA